MKKQLLATATMRRGRHRGCSPILTAPAEAAETVVTPERARDSTPSEEEILRLLTAELRRAVAAARRAVEKGLQAAQEASVCSKSARGKSATTTGLSLGR